MNKEIIELANEAGWSEAGLRLLMTAVDVESVERFIAICKERGAQAEKAKWSICFASDEALDRHVKAYIEADKKSRKQLTMTQIQEILTKTFSDDSLQPDDMALIRAVEVAHEITA